VDITQLILDDHHEQRRLFAILEQIDRTHTGVLSAVWSRLAAFLELHAAAEEEIFYPALLQVGLAGRRAAGVEEETLDAIHDHNEIRDAVTEVARHQVGTDAWYAAVAAANLANSDHMAEEEREGLTDFRRLAGLQRRHDLAVAYVGWLAAGSGVGAGAAQAVRGQVGQGGIAVHGHDQVRFGQEDAQHVDEAVNAADREAVGVGAADGDRGGAQG
jgi:hypothetical protein